MRRMTMMFFRAERTSFELTSEYIEHYFLTYRHHSSDIRTQKVTGKNVIFSDLTQVRGPENAHGGP